jgi:hypothetical protein
VVLYLPLLKRRMARCVRMRVDRRTTCFGDLKADGVTRVMRLRGLELCVASTRCGSECGSKGQ